MEWLVRRSDDDAVSCIAAPLNHAKASLCESWVDSDDHDLT
uniref:Uncharacterized protein n=1 Tax=Candidatus Methanogaster sp. ANME-2c ERB4 TaxID=2759911 RepID=A0A7G9Y1G3_9EURY|nr:hypothetical protein BDEPBIDA_00001 [Methanosarcinales archaeon ANME-2c ERB4]